MDTLIQLPLNIQLEPEATIDNFIIGNNALLVNYLREFVQNDDHLVYLFGSSGSGRSHLLQALCHMAEHQQRVIYLPLTDLHNHSADCLENLEHYDIVVLDDIDFIASSTPWQTQLFHLYNRMQDTGAKLAVSAACSPKEIQLTLADLQSRLNTGTIFQLQLLSDEEKQLFLKTRARELGLELNDQVSQFLIHRVSRDLPNLFNTLQALDHASLSTKRRLTIPLIKQVLTLN